ncbi:MAG: FAD-dependent oxidoreductase [Candidatus Brocadiia bacterium]
MPETYSEPGREIPVLGEYDVIVCGGGPAGCAAALASARQGAHTLLIEKHGALGGAPVTQNVLSVLSTNGVDFQGIWHDWARQLQKYDGISSLSRQDREGFPWIVGSLDPTRVPFAWDDLLTDAGAEILHFVLATDTIVEDDTARGIVVESRGGRTALFAKRIVDATGDGTICAAAGVPFDHGVDGNSWAMAVSLNAYYGGVKTSEEYEPGQTNPVGGTGRSLAIAPLFQAGLLRLLEVDPLNPADLTRAVREGRSQIWERFQSKKQQDASDDVYLANIADEPGVRSSRRIHGLATATADDAWEFNKYPDAIARSSWEIDIHRAEEGSRKVVDYQDENYIPRRRLAAEGDYFDIRYGAIVAKGIDNLLMGGRCISAEHHAQSSLRIQQTCQSTGEAAGLAAALSLEEGTTPAELSPNHVVGRLERERAEIEPAFDMLC